MKDKELLRKLKNQLEFNRELGNKGMTEILEVRVKQLEDKIGA